MRYGKDRVYVKTADGHDVGYVDLVERAVVANGPAYEAALQECLSRWTWVPEQITQAETELSIPVTPEEPPTHAQPAEPMEARPPTSEHDVRDLAANVAGAAARAKRNEVNAQAPVLNFIARALGIKTEERAWRVGAKGEEKVADELAKLGPAWRVLHAIEVGANGSDIDHVVVGPAGVITLNAKRHPHGKAWVGERMVMVNGQRTDYLRNSRFEAQRAARLLSASCGKPVAVTAAVVFVDLDDFSVRQMPADVHVTTRRRLVKWLESLPAAIDPATVEDIYSKARLSSTWI